MKYEVGDIVLYFWLMDSNKAIGKITSIRECENGVLCGMKVFCKINGDDDDFEDYNHSVIKDPEWLI